MPQYFTERGELLSQTQKLFDISQKLSAASDLQEVLLAIAGSIESVEFDRASMLSIDTNEAKEIEALHILANWGRTEDVQVVPVGMTMPAEVFPAIDIFKNPDISLVNDYETDERFDEATRKWLAESGMYSGLFIPVYDGDKPIAGIVLGIHQNGQLYRE